MPRVFRIVDPVEVEDNWDAETTSSWSQITNEEPEEEPEDEDEEDACNATPPPRTPEAADVDADTAKLRTTPPPQITIPIVDSTMSVEGEKEGEGDGSSSEEDPSFSSSQEADSSHDNSETPEPAGLVMSEEGREQRCDDKDGILVPSVPVATPDRLSSPALRLFLSPRTPPKKHKRSKSRDDSNSNSRRSKSAASVIQSVPKRYFVYAVCFWMLELVLVITLKRVGVIEPEFQEASVSAIKLPALVLQSLKLWVGNETVHSLQYLTQEKKRPGFQLAQQGAIAKYPLVLIPGFVTSGLEVWGGKECARKHFRQRMWAALIGARSFFTDRDCWRQHMMLDPLTGGDPPGIRLRAASGFEAVDYFMANYWVFGKIIENLADVGYTPSEMSVEPYDWRLAFPMLEERDGYFTRVKNKIEAMHKISRKKVVITSHSMGVLVVHYFFAWVTSPANGGHRKWVDQHVHAYVNIAGSHLGVPKAITSLLSGEMSDTVVMNPMAQAVESFFGRRLRRELWGTWGSIWAMIPKGGNALWSVGADMCPQKNKQESTIVSDNDDGNTRDNKRGQQAEHRELEENQCSDEKQKSEYGSSTSSLGVSSTNDPFCPCSSSGKVHHAPFLTVTDDKEVLDEIVDPHVPSGMNRWRNKWIVHKSNETEVDNNITVIEKNPLLKRFLAQGDFSLKPVVDFVQEHGLRNQLANARMYSFYGSPSNPTAHRKQESAWHDPTQTPLPYAPNTKIYCLYGVGKLTERAYYYKLNRPDPQQHDSNNNGNNTPEKQLLDPPLILDSEVSDPDNNIITGIKYTDGDGSVPLLSLGYLCADAWTRPNSGLNPSRADVYTREYRHKAEFTVDDPMRSGPKSGDHVDMLGNVEMTEDLLRILTDFEVEEKVNQNRIVSDIQQIARDIHAQGGGIFQRGNRQGQE